MRTPDLAKAFQVFSSVMAEKKSISAKECMAVEKLNRALSLTGYRIRPMNPIPHEKHRRRRSGPRNRSRKQGLHQRTTGIAPVRRPGRPKLRQVA